MEMKNYQKIVIKDFKRYLELLNEKKNMGSAFSEFWNEKQVPIGENGLKPYNNIIKNTPHVCFKVPTGGGKTFIACNCIKPLFDSMDVSKPKVVVWLVPSDSILDQTVNALTDTEHPYRQKIDVDFNSRVEVLTKEQALNGQGFKPDTVNEQLTILVLTYDSFRGRSKEVLKAFRENSNLADFPRVFNESTIEVSDADETSLIQTINRLSPFVIVDESHHAQSELSIEMLMNFNPCFVLDLTATPKENSNIISFVDARQLKKENMVKLPIILYNHENKDDVIFDAITLRAKLEARAKKEEETTGKYIRPIVLFQAQPKGGEENTTFEKLKDNLVKAGIPKDEIAIKTSQINELKNIDLMNKSCKIKYIITVNALKEGWDCPFAYILATIANKNSIIDVEQIVGRVLRQPFTVAHTDKVLNMSYVLTSSNDFHTTVNKVIKGLQNSGFSGKDYRIGNGEVESRKSVEDENDSIKQINFEIINTESTGMDYESSEYTDNTDEILDDSVIDFNTDLLEERLAQVNPEESNTDDEIFEEAIKLSDAYTESIIENVNSEESEVSLEVRDKMFKYEICDEFKESISNIELPQFYLVTPQISMFEANGDEEVLLKSEHLSKGFTLKDKDIIISFDVNEGDIAKVDIEDNKDMLPKYSKLTGFDNKHFRELLNSQPNEKKISMCKGIIQKQLSKMDEIDDSELRGYIDRVIDNMTIEQIATLETSAIIYAKRIKDKINALLSEHKKAQFRKWLDLGKIIIKPSYTFPNSISPLRSASMISKSLYLSEADDGMNNFEKNVILRVAALPNILWWHRNISKTGFRINGYINHYPDFIVMTTSGKIILIETKGDDRDGSDSENKAILGRLWHDKLDSNFQYYMVFETKGLTLNGCYSIDKFMDLIKEL